MEDIDILDNLDWDPYYLASIFNHDFFDMTELWNGSSCLSDTDLVNALDSTGNMLKRDVYAPIVEDVSLDDNDLRVAVENIEHE